jgi:hypothetical protein
MGPNSAGSCRQSWVKARLDALRGPPGDCRLEPVLFRKGIPVDDILADLKKFDAGYALHAQDSQCGGKVAIPDLNKMAIPTDGTAQPPDDNSIKTDSNVRVYFRNLEDTLVRYISCGRANLVVGCVAWLTNKRILSALAGVKRGVSLVVQKEDFLRPDIDSGKSWKASLREMYGRLPRPPLRYSFPNIVSSLSVCGDPSIEPVRCVGNHNRTRLPAFPRMHNKFLIFCKVKDVRRGEDWTDKTVEPKCVWTGSFNLTENATRSLENAVVLTEKSVVDAFFREWGQIMAISEPLDWSSDWCEPEWRVGT